MLHASCRVYDERFCNECALWICRRAKLADGASAYHPLSACCKGVVEEEEEEDIYDDIDSDEEDIPLLFSTLAEAGLTVHPSSTRLPVCWSVTRCYARFSHQSLSQAKLALFPALPVLVDVQQGAVVYSTKNIPVISHRMTS